VIGQHDGKPKLKTNKGEEFYILNEKLLYENKKQTVSLR
jgi:hypothetical protein